MANRKTPFTMERSEGLRGDELPLLIIPALDLAIGGERPTARNLFSLISAY